MAIWLVKAGYQGMIADKFRDQKKIAVGWNTLGDFPTHGEWDEFRAEVKKRLPEDYSGQKVGAAAGQLWSFVRAMKQGDFVITPVKSTREVLVGKVTGDYKYDPSFDSGHPRTRAVVWFHPIQWDTIPSDLRNSFTIWQTIAKPTANFAPLIEAAQSPSQASAILKSVEESATGEIATQETEDLSERAEEAVRERLKKMGHEDFQRIVGAVFKAAGFTELYNSAGIGADSGIDIILSRNPLGAGERIIVQVKHTSDPVGQPDLQQLLGTLKQNEFGLMVGLNGVKSNGQRYWRENRDRLLRPMDATGLIQMLQENYEKLQDEDKALLPLKRVFVPFNIDEEG
jgi:restriction system protein